MGRRRVASVGEKEKERSKCWGGEGGVQVLGRRRRVQVSGRRRRGASFGEEKEGRGASVGRRRRVASVGEAKEGSKSWGG